MHISQTVAVALIAVAGTLGSGVLSYLAARRSTEVQLRGIAVDMEKLQALHAEEGRRERQEAYYGFITSIEEMMQYVFGLRGTVTEDGYLELVQKFSNEHTRVLFLGSTSVVEVADEMLSVFSAFATAAAEEEETEKPKDRLRKAFDAISKDWGETKMDLLRVMKEDIAQHRS